jgi:hypothetical protein
VAGAGGQTGSVHYGHDCAPPTVRRSRSADHQSTAVGPGSGLGGLLRIPKKVFTTKGFSEPVAARYRTAENLILTFGDV